jgi:hypothetical protein
MRILSRNVLDLKPGLARVRSLEQRLQLEWGPRLARWSQAQDRAAPWHALGDLMLGLAVVFGGSVFCGLLCNGIAAPTGDVSVYILPAVVAALSIGLVVSSIFVKKRAKKLGGGTPKYKKAPAITGLSQSWWQELEAEARRMDQAMDQKMDETHRYGSPGEHLLMDRLKYALPDSYFAVRGWKGVDYLDTDILVLGPNGIWILESKYWSGTVHFDGKSWVR